MCTNTLTNADLTNLITLVGFTIGNGSDLSDKWFSIADDLIQKLATIRDDESARRVANAAPELLAALHSLLTTALAVDGLNKSRLVDVAGFDASLFDQCRQAIAKATGATT